MSACHTGKVRYETPAAARFFAYSDGMRSYRCPECRGWHLSSKGVQRRKTAVR